jgi:hypothetical protein
MYIAMRVRNSSSSFWNAATSSWIAGVTAIEVEVTRRYSLQDIAESGASDSLAALSEAERKDVDGKFVSAFIRARKPAEA